MSNIERYTTSSDNPSCANCGYYEIFHPIYISGRKVQERGQIFLDWLCEEFKPSNHSHPSIQAHDKSEDCSSDTLRGSDNTDSAKGCGKFIHNLLCWDDKTAGWNCGQYYDAYKAKIYCKTCREKDPHIEHSVNDHNIIPKGGKDNNAKNTKTRS